jgi:hypothetical protein
MLVRFEGHAVHLPALVRFLGFVLRKFFGQIGDHAPELCILLNGFVAPDHLDELLQLVLVDERHRSEVIERREHDVGLAVIKIRDADCDCGIIGEVRAQVAVQQFEPVLCLARQERSDHADAIKHGTERALLALGMQTPVSGIAPKLSR